MLSRKREAADRTSLRCKGDADHKGFRRKLIVHLLPQMFRVCAKGRFEAPGPTRGCLLSRRKGKPSAQRL
eukprot:3735640-Rhodomonas_salina.2